MSALYMLLMQKLLDLHDYVNLAILEYKESFILKNSCKVRRLLCYQWPHPINSTARGGEMKLVIH